MTQITSRKKRLSKMAILQILDKKRFVFLFTFLTTLLCVTISYSNSRYDLPSSLQTTISESQKGTDNQSDANNNIDIVTKVVTDDNSKPYMDRNVEETVIKENVIKNSRSTTDEQKRSTASSTNKQDQDYLITDCEIITGSPPKYLSSTLTTRPKSSVQSLFNCDLPNSKCNYFYPANFLHEECGLGREFHSKVVEMEELRKNKTLWLNMPDIGFPTVTLNNVEFPLSSSSTVNSLESDTRRRLKGTLTSTLNENNSAFHEDLREDRETQRVFIGGSRKNDLHYSVLEDIGEHINKKNHTRYLTERISFLHVHKSGGTSLHTAFDKLSYKPNGYQLRHKFFTPHFYKNEESPIWNQTLSDLEKSIHYPTDIFDAREHFILATIRDPVERFISSIGQATGGEGSSGNVIGKVLVKECKQNTSHETLKCMAKYVQQHGFWIELHFTPQVLDIAFTTMLQDVPVGIFSFKDIGVILDYLGAPSAQGRNGANPHYRVDEVFTNMSIDDYDDETLEIVCNIYKMDVVVMRVMGMEVPLCDPFIPKDDTN